MTCEVVSEEFQTRQGATDESRAVRSDTPSYRCLEQYVGHSHTNTEGEIEYMPYHPTPWFPSAAERQQGKDLAALDQRSELAQEEVASLGRLEARAHFEKMKAGLLRREAERIMPGAAEEYDMISLASTMAMINVIDRFSRGRR